MGARFRKYASKMESSIKASGREMFVTVMEYRSGRTGLDTRDTGKMERQQVKVSLPMSMGMCTTVSGEMTKRADREFIFITTALDTKENGSMIISTASE